VRDIDPEIAIGDARPLERIVEASMAARRYQTMLFVAFAGTALAIAMIGVYAVTAYGVTRRRREMNIRVALGAKAVQVVGLVAGQTAVPIAAGALAGAAGALALGGTIANLLVDVPARDPVIVASVVSAVSVAGAIACLIAVRRELILDPARALRQE
jgi:ABC-type antimicrobial peptide transport system permease subunit